MSSGLEYKKPAGRINYKYTINVCVYIINVALIVFLFVRKKKAMDTQYNEVPKNRTKKKRILSGRVRFQMSSIYIRVMEIRKWI